MSESNGNHLINRPKTREGKTGGTKFFVKTMRRLLFKYTANEIVVNAIGQKQAETGRGHGAPIKANMHILQKQFPDIFEEYALDRGKPLTANIIIDRVHKMYYSYDAKNGIKCHGKSQEHPDYWPSNWREMA